VRVSKISGAGGVHSSVNAFSAAASAAAGQLDDLFK
jgi:hypothetical protein